MKKKILLLNGSLKMGGAEKMMAYLANLLCKEYDVVFLLLNREEHFFELDKAIRVIEYNNITSRKGRINFIKSFTTLGKAVNLIHKVIKQENIDLVISFKDKENLLSYLACKCLVFNSTKLLLSQRGDPYDKNIVWDKINKYLYNRCDGVAFQLPQVQEYYKIPKVKSKIIPNPSTIELTETNNMKKKKIISAGRLAEIKKFDDLISSFEIVHKKFPEYELYIYGEGPEKINLLNLISKLNLNNSVFICQPDRNVITNNLDAEIFVFSSRSEGIPNILIEALSSGIPCIATDCSPGGARFLLNENKNGILVAVGDINGMANAIMRLIENKDLAVNYAASAYEYMKMFSIEKINNKWLEYINYVINK